MGENISLADAFCALMQPSILTSCSLEEMDSSYLVNHKPSLQIRSFKSMPVFSKLQRAVLNLELSSILEFDSRKVGYLLRLTVFFKKDNGAALPLQETFSSHLICIQKQ